jgi:hypothetical protein
LDRIAPPDDSIIVTPHWRRTTSVSRYTSVASNRYRKVLAAFRAGITCVYGVVLVGESEIAAAVFDEITDPTVRRS